MSRTKKGHVYKPFSKESKFERDRTNHEFRKRVKQAIARAVRLGTVDELSIEKSPATCGWETW